MLYYRNVLLRNVSSADPLFKIISSLAT